MAQAVKAMADKEDGIDRALTSDELPLLNCIASASPAACCGECERIKKIGRIPYSRCEALTDVRTFPAACCRELQKSEINKKHKDRRNQL